MGYDELKAFLAAKEIRFYADHPLHAYTTFRLGGPADIFVTPATPEEMAELQAFITGRGLPVLLLGGGSNLLVSDAGFRGVVIHPQLGEDLQIRHQSAERLEVFVPASARAPLSGKRISALGFAGVEFLTTIPGHFGGSVIQNAGCYGHELKDSLVNVEIVHGGDTEVLKTGDCAFTYRNSLFKGDPGIWVTGATLELSKGDLSLIEARITDYKNRRIASQPKNRRSAGSIFKNPAGRKAWQLIDEAGLRGIREGGAEISAEHCNFIVNAGGAKAADVEALARLIEERVFEKTGIRLEREVVFVGDFPGRQ